ncbi:MAG: hypothetical protein KAS73_04205 [Candidatus Sabulitectum sp.]|nr:hypothetical protein [Candidatus Sabulitectum sp.]
MKSLLGMLMLMLIVLAAGCGEADQQEPADSSGAESVEDAQVAEDAPVEVEVAPLYPEGTLDPSLVTADVPVAAGALFNAFYAWDEQTVVIQGYPFVHYGDSITIEDDIELVAVAGERDKLVKVTFPETLNLRIAADELVTVSGTVDYSWTGRIELVEGIVVTDAVVVPIDEVSPYAYDGTSAVEVQGFFDLFNIWIGMEVTVEGYYISTTTSSLSSGDVVRIDLQDSETRSKCAACEMTGDIPEDISAGMTENRDGVQIRGIIEGESFNIVGLVECELVNR